MSLLTIRPVSCTECGFTTTDLGLIQSHSCEVAQSGRCEDFPCCGHEFGDCNGELYGSPERIAEQVQRDWDNGHGYCEHESGLYNC